jgi:ElaB/YqjD/DUF883 family membrane-anchored ribosome-binding protein
MPEAASPPNHLLNNLPNTTGVQQTSASVESGIGGLISSFNSMSPGNPQSPLSTIASSLGEVGKRVNFDPKPLQKLYPDALYVMQNALPADTLDYIRSIESAYEAAQDFLKNSALVREIKPGSTLQDVALAAVKDVLRAFDERQLALQANLIDPQLLDEFKSALTLYEQFSTDFAAHRADLLPFLSKHLFGVEPDVLKHPLDHLNASLSVLAPLSPSALEGVLKPVQDSLTQAFADLSNLAQTFDPADVTAYANINVRLTALEAAMNGLQQAVAPLYLQLNLLVNSHDWDEFFPELTKLLQAIKLDAPPSIDDVIQGLSAIIERIQGQLFTFFGPQDLVARMEAMSLELSQLFSNSAIGQVRRVIREFLEQIRHAIENIPTEKIQQAIEDMLKRVKQEVDELGLDRLAQTIEKGFQEAENFITEHINETLTNDVRAAIKSLLDNLKNLPLETLFSNITTAIESVQQLLNELDTAMTAGVDDVKGLLSKLEELSFKPVSDIVVGEIDELKKRVQAIKPNALSDPEKLAIKAALAFLEGVHIEDIIETEAKQGFDAATGAVKPLLDDLQAVLDRLREQLDAYRPERFVATLIGLLDEAEAVVNKLDAKVLLRPLYEQVDAFVQRLQSLSPGSLLDPLQQPFNSVINVVKQLDPVQIIAPLNSLYAEMDKMINYVDVTPLFDELDRRQKELFKLARTSLVAALDKLALPEPFKEFFDGVRPVLEAMTEAIFQDPDTELQRLSLDLSTRFSITSLFKPLDKVFDQLMNAVASIPHDDLLEAFETLRKTIGVALEALNPRKIIELFRQGQRQLEELSPQLLFALPLSLPSLKLAFQTRAALAPAILKDEVGATLIRFDAVIQLTNPNDAQSLIATLAKAHNELTETVRRRINSLDIQAADAAYGGMREQLIKVVPDFLRQPAQLAHADIISGLESLRPSHKAADLQRVFDRFQQQLKPMQSALETAGQKFFRAIRDTLDLLNPLSLKDAVADIYKVIHAKVRILDPVRLAASLNDIFQPVMDALKALDPAALKARLNTAYQKVLKAIVDNIRPILDDIAKALDEELHLIRDEVKKVFEELKQTIEQATKIFTGMVKKIEDLVFVEVLARLRQVLDNLGISFDKELDRIRNAFDQMLAALPLDIGPKKAAVASPGL